MDKNRVFVQSKVAIVGKSLELSTEIVKQTDPISTLTRIIFNTEDELIRQGLIALGWTPPEEKKNG